jgi:hypothetical protein
MGLDINRFSDDVDEEFKCSICLNVLEQPVHGSCGHVFCLTCISVWLESSSSHGYGSVAPSASRLRRGPAVGTCPVDRKQLRKEDLIEVALPFRAFLFRLKIKCDYEPYGCKSVLALGALKDHVRDCNFNPDEQVECPNGCKRILPRKYLLKDNHNCVKELMKVIRRQDRVVTRLEDELAASKILAKKVRRWLIWITGVILAMVLMALIGPKNESKNSLTV